MPPSTARGSNAAVPDQRGAMLMEAVIAMAMVVVMSAAFVQLLIWATGAAFSSAARTSAIVLASQKLEQLRALAWTVDEHGAPVSDQTTDLSREPATGGGSGLQASPAGTLDANVPGFVDFLDADGRWCGTGVHPPACAVFVRRWAIVPLAADPADTLLLHVVVRPVAQARGAGRTLPDARVTSARTRL